MTAGTGVLHSEMNEGRGAVHLYQIRFIPDRGGLKPSYQQGRFPLSEKPNSLVPMVSKEGTSGALSMNSPATLYGCLLEPGHDLPFKAPGHGLFVYITSGGLRVNETMLGEGDQMRCVAHENLTFAADVECRFVLIDMPGGK
jgi:redox-sensitive bicupin YhaK (pirin superfamily)